MTGHRKFYRVLLKSITILGVFILAVVMLLSLNPPDHGQNTPAQTLITETVTIPLDSIQALRLTETIWMGKKVSVLLRDESPQAGGDTHADGLNSAWRSVDPRYFVFINAAGPAQCPLKLAYDGKSLKDICSGISYDTTGRAFDRPTETLNVPPHYLTEDTLIIGQWNGDVIGK